MDDLLERNINSAPLAQIINHHLIQTCMRLGITKNAVVYTTMESLKDFRGRGKIHVCHPERIQLRPPIVFDAARALALDPLVKFASHPGLLSLLLFLCSSLGIHQLQPVRSLQ